MIWCYCSSRRNHCQHQGAHRICVSAAHATVVARRYDAMVVLVETRASCRVSQVRRLHCTCCATRTALLHQQWLWENVWQHREGRADIARAVYGTLVATVVRRLWGSRRNTFRAEGRTATQRARWLHGLSRDGVAPACVLRASRCNVCGISVGCVNGVVWRGGATLVGL